jgi:CDGSH iron-sulfur domain-containing protein 3
MRITLTENGPYRVDGARDLDLRGPDGRPITVRRDTVFLCRCGGSANKPFCDGTHARVWSHGAASGGADRRRHAAATRTTSSA